MALTIKIRADASHFKKTIAGIEVQAGGLTGVMGKLATSQLAFGAALSAAAAGAVALGAGLAFIKDASGKAAGIESLTMQFEVLTGSADKAKSLIKEFRDEAVKSPLNVQDYAQAARTFMSYGMTAEKTLPMLKMLGDISLGNSQRFALLSYAMAQVSSNATLNGEDLRQLVSQGFNPLAVISQKTGKSMADLRKEMENHQITYAMVEDAMKQVTSQGGRFFGAIEKGSATTEGKIAKLGDAVLGLKVAFGEGFNVGLKSALDSTNQILPQLESKFAYAGRIIGLAIKDSVAGNHEMIAAVGSVIGEVIMAGVRSAIKIGVDTLIREGIGGYLSLGGHVMGDQNMKNAGNFVNAAIGAALGPGKGMADTISGELQSGGLKSAMDKIDRMGSESWGDYLKRQVEQNEELIRQGKTSLEELRKAFKDTPRMTAPMFSR